MSRAPWWFTSRASVAVAILLLAMVARTGHAGMLSGQIVDAQSGQPVAGAVVLVVWVYAGGAPGLTHSEVVDVQDVETDAEGRFTFESLAGPLVEERITVYTFGYVGWSNLYSFSPLRRRERAAGVARIELAPFPAGESSEEHLLFIDIARSAGLYGDSKAARFEAAVARERSR